MKKTKKRRLFRHLTRFARDRIEAFLKSGHTQEDIAKVLGVDASTVSREIQKRKRKNGCYDAVTAQQKARVKRSNSKHPGMKIEQYPELRDRIIAQVKQYRSPDEIAGRMQQEGYTPRVNANSIYKWLYSVWGQPWCRYLCTKRYRRKKQKRLVKREMIPQRISLSLRPKRGEHAEGDLFVSPTRLGTTVSGALVCVPGAQLLAGTLLPNRKPKTMAYAMRGILRRIAADDMTLDNGIENKDHASFGISTYFCDPHSPWQKPHVEQAIGLLRRWFLPKRTDLRTISEAYLQQCLHRLNGKYRKSLNYQSAYEVALARGIIQKIPHVDAGKKKNLCREKVAFHYRI